MKSLHIRAGMNLCIIYYYYNHEWFTITMSTQFDNIPRRKQGLFDGFILQTFKTYWLTTLQERV